MNNCDLEEIKYVALQKFLELAKDPSKWEDAGSYYYSRGKFEIKYWGDKTVDIRIIGTTSFRCGSGSDYALAVEGIKNWHEKQRKHEQEQKICEAIHKSISGGLENPVNEQREEPSFWKRIFRNS